MLELLRITKYYIKTIHGISADYNCNLLYQLFGILQGSGAGPALWLSVSIVLILAYKQKFKVRGIPDVSNKLFLSKLLDAFVDDTDLWDVLTSVNNDPNTLAKRMQIRAQFWEKLLFTTGGKLNFNKCYWYLIKWCWDANGNPHLCSNNECPASLSLTNGNDLHPVTITRIEPTEALETLGVWTSPSATNNKNFKETTHLMTTLATAIKSASISPKDASMLIPVYLHSKLRYKFAATTFTQSECDDIDKKF